MRRVYLMSILVFVFAFASFYVNAEIVVLAETPVAEFTLPDGSVLTNAFVWKRTSEGIMIIHDDGQYYLNFKTLPENWRKAYEVVDEVEQVQGSVGKRYDQYKVYPMLERINGLTPKAAFFFESERYDGKSDDVLLAACALQCLLDGQNDKAKRLYRIMEKQFPEYKPVALDSLYKPCEACRAKGELFKRCLRCNGSGKCLDCGGDGLRDSQFQNEAPTHCTTCRGTGKCPKCGGSGEIKFKCTKCKGTGNILLQDKLDAELASLVAGLNATCVSAGR